MELLWVSLASFLAGFIDSIVGGGGLVLVPTLFTTYPSAHPATLFGTNKGASVCGGCGVTVAGAAAGCGGVRCGDFLHASAGAKLLALFAAKGHVWWHLVAGMALANVLGSWAGTHLALQHGAVFVRRVFIAVVLALIAKTGWDAFTG